MKAKSDIFANDMLKQRIFINTLVNSFGKTLSLILQLLIITYLVKTIGKEAYGVVVLALDLVGNTNLMEAGFGLSVTKYVAEYRARDDRNAILEIVNTNFIVSTVIALIFCGILLTINEFFLERLFTVPPSLLQPAKAMIRILTLLSFVEFWSVGIIRILEGFQKYSVARITEVFKWIVRFVLIIFAVENGYGLIGVGIAYFAAGVINLVILYYFVFSRDANLELNISRANKKTFKQLFSFSIWIFLSKIFAFISYRIDIVVISIFLPIENLTYYNIAFKIYETLRYGFALLSSTLVPVTSEIAASLNKEKLCLLFKKASKYTVVLMFPVLTIFFVYADKVIHLWLGEGFSASILLSQLFIVSLFFTALIASGSEMMTGMNKLKELVKYNGVGSFLNLILSIILVQEVGVYGVVIGTVVGSLVISAGYLYQMMQEFSISFVKYLRSIVLIPVVLTVVFGTVLAIINSIVVGFLTVVIYFSIIFFVLIEEEDRAGILRLFKNQTRFGYFKS